MSDSETQQEIDQIETELADMLQSVLSTPLRRLDEQLIGFGARFSNLENKVTQGGYEVMGAVAGAIEDQERQVTKVIKGCVEQLSGETTQRFDALGGQIGSAANNVVEAVARAGEERDRKIKTLEKAVCDLRQSLIDKQDAALKPLRWLLVVNAGLGTACVIALAYLAMMR